VFKEDEEKGAAFVGWFVTGSANSRVFFTDNPPMWLTSSTIAKNSSNQNWLKS
jgi:hypothetical protein